jgi:hypothetical protein
MPDPADGCEVEPRYRIAGLRCRRGIALEIREHVVDASDACAFGVRLLFQQLAQHPLGSMLDGQRNQSEQIDHAEDLVLVLAWQTLDSAHEPQNVV